jgi:hypothetical protein
MEITKADQQFGVDDIRKAVAAGTLDQTQADRFVEFLAAQHNVGYKLADEEQFRLITSFNDIFVTIGIGLFLGALMWLVTWGPDQNTSGFGSAFAIAVASWLLAEIFTRRRRMALPSIVLLLSFTLSSAICASLVYTYAAKLRHLNLYTDIVTDDPVTLVVASLTGSLAACVHWFRFKVPITVAAGVAALAGLILAIVSYNDPNWVWDYPYFTALPLGLLVLALALWIDSTDRLRLTRRTDIAFWLHMLAAPLIVHPVVYPLIIEDGLDTAGAVIIITLFFFISLLALIIDRRALLVSSLSYFGYAAYQMVKLAGLEGQGTAFAVLIVGATVLLLSVGWQALRQFVVAASLTFVQTHVPPIKRHQN